VAPKRIYKYPGVLFAARLRNVGLVLIMLILIAVFFIAVIDDLKNQRPIGNYKYWLPILSMILMVAFGRMPLGNMLEKTGKEQLATYFMFGPLKLNLKSYEEVGTAKIEQDEKKYYLMIVEHSKGKLVIEKYPTLDKATEYLGLVTQFMVEGEKVG
jgi:hypothetical protein